MRNQTKILALIIMTVVLSIISISHAEVIHVLNGSSFDVQSAINSASDGDTVVIPSGNYTWSSTVTIPSTKGITLQGAGIGNTVITFDTDIYLNMETNETNSPVRVTGFTFKGGHEMGAIVINDRDIGAKNWRIDHCEFIYYNSKPFNGIIVKGYTWGLIDHCTFYNTPRGIFIEMGLNDATYLYFGDYSWMQPITIGGPDAVYVEDCTFTNTWDGTAQGIETRWGGRYVIRYSTLNGYYNIETHSGHTNGGRNPRWIEVYENTIDVGAYDRWTPMFLRSTNGVVFNNTAIGHTNDIKFDYEMASAAGAYPWVLQTDYPGQDQPGRGQDTGWGTTQAILGLWAWNNTLDGSPLLLEMHGANQTMKDLLQEDRDYYNSQKLGYTPYTYPHPLTNTGIAGGIAPPKNLRIKE